MTFTTTTHPATLIGDGSLKITPRTMKGLRIVQDAWQETTNGPSTSLILADLPIPESVAGSVLVQIHAVAINPSDAANARGYFPHATFPRIPGRDWAGVVVDGSHPLFGKRVFGTSGRQLGFSLDGPSAEYCLIPEDGLVEVPEGLSMLQAATIGVPWTTAYLMVERSGVCQSDVVVITGSSGAVGSAACQLARARGCKVFTAARRSAADIDLRHGLAEIAKIKDLTDGQGPSVVLDTVGDPQLMSACLDQLRVGGRIAYISAPKLYQTQFCFDMKKFYRMEKSIIGCNSLQSSISKMGTVLRMLAPDFCTGGKYKANDSSEISVCGINQALDSYREVWERDTQAQCAEALPNKSKFVIQMP